MKRSWFCLATSVLALSASCEALAQEQPQEPIAELGDIIVTAQKRAENLQRVPLAVSALSGETLQDLNISDITQTATLVPSVNVQQRLSYGVVTIRGVGYDQLTVGSESSVAVHQDGVYIARPTQALAGFYDVERFEISRGPQGTLFGRNSTGGAANIISRKPTAEAEGYINATVGNYSAFSVDGALSGPLIDDTLMARFAFKTDDRDGYGENIFNGQDIEDMDMRAFRGQLLYKPNSRFSILLSGDYYRQRDNSIAMHFGGYYVPCSAATTFPACGTNLGGITAPKLRDIANDFQPTNDRKFYGLSATIDLALTDTIDLRSISAWRKGSTDFSADSDGTTADLLWISRIEKNRQISEELQLIGTSDRLKWILGGYFFDDKTDGIPGGSFGPTTGRGAFLQGGVLNSAAYAVFGQATYDLTDQFSVTLGGRYSTEKKSIEDEYFYPGAGPVRSVPDKRSKTFKAFTPKFGIEFKPNPDILAFVNVQKGFKSGGYSPGSVDPVTNQFQAPFDQEILWSYEAGLKMSLGRARLNLTGFHYDYSDIQVGRVENVSSVISNAGAANVDGLEAEATVPITHALRFDLTGSWLNARFSEYETKDPGRLALGVLDLKGNKLSQAPEFSWNVGIQHRWDVGSGDLTLRGEWFHSTRVWFSPFNVKAFSQPSYDLFNAFLNYDNGDHWSASLFVRNIADKSVMAGGYVSSGLFGFPQNVTLQPPRVFGAKVGYRF